MRSQSLVVAASCIAGNLCHAHGSTVTTTKRKEKKRTVTVCSADTTLPKLLLLLLLLLLIRVLLSVGRRVELQVCSKERVRVDAETTHVYQRRPLLKVQHPFESPARMLYHLVSSTKLACGTDRWFV